MHRRRQKYNAVKEKFPCKCKRAAEAARLQASWRDYCPWIGKYTL
jgi:hypothetical protein